MVLYYNVSLMLCYREKEKLKFNEFSLSKDSLMISAVAQWIRTRFGIMRPGFDPGHRLLCLEDGRPSKNDLASSPPGCLEVQVCGILLHTSCLISELRCLMSLHVCNKDAIFYIIIIIIIKFIKHLTPKEKSWQTFLANQYLRGQ